MRKVDFSQLTGEIITWYSPLYNEARQEWNRAIEKYPIAIVYCHNTFDVCNAISWARWNSISIRIRSGGHNYEGYSVGDCVLVIDISRMNKVKVMEDRKLVKVQGGIKNREFYEAVSTLGYPLPGGSCPTVGVSGYTLGGGWGYSSRYFGLGCDSLKEVELVNYDGKIIVANEYENKDLFWALRGAGGGNFGVVVSLTFKLPERVQGVTLLSVYFPKASKDKLVEVFNAVQMSLPSLDRRLTTITSIYNSQEEGVASYTRGVFYGQSEDALKTISFLTSIEGAVVYAEYMSFIDAMRIIMNSYPPYEHFKSTGRFVYKEYTKEELEGFIDLIMTRPNNSIFIGLTLYALGGAVADIPSNCTAFYYRQAAYILGIQSVYLDNKYTEENVRWVESRFKYIYPLTEGSFVNFPYAELKDYMKEYYGNNQWWLKWINHRYDPYNVFSFPQSIGRNKC